MNTLKFSILIAAFAALTACKQEAAAPAAPEPAPAESAVSAETTAPTGQTFVLASEKDAKWQSYQCHDGLALSARYFSENGKPVAEIRFEGKLFKLPHNSEHSNQDSTAFGNDGHAWTVSNQGQADDLYKEDNGFLVRREEQKVGSEVMPVDAILAKNCMPAQ